MGYDLHITRRKSWNDDGDDISKEEFLACIRPDAEFTHPGALGDDHVDWKSRRTGAEAWLCWQEGCIDAKDPESEFLDKMVRLAKALGAKVQGDDEEVYLSSNRIRKHQVVRSPVVVFLSWPLRKQLVAAFLFGSVLLALKLLFFK